MNVGSLFLQPEGHGGKLAYLRAQMHQLCLNVLGLQETRSPAGMSTADEILRLSSGATDGQHGVELWISLRQPIGYAARRPVHIQAKHVQVLHSDPRRLFVRLAHPSLQCQFFVLHAPQSGRPLQERREWWNSTQQIVHHFACGVPLYLLIDANAKTGPTAPPIVFDQDDIVSANTELFRAFLEENSLCLPCTAASLHPDKRTTWTAVDGRSTHRIDYIAVPQMDMPHCVHSAVLDTLDPGNSFDDHHAVALQMQWTCQTSSGSSSRTALVRHDRAAIRTQKHHIALDEIAPCEWKADIEQHVATFNQQVLDKVHAACPLHKQGPKKPFLTDEVWQLRVAKLHLRKRLQTARKQMSADCLRLAIWAWQSSALRRDSTADSQATVGQHHAHVSSTWCVFVRLNCRFYTLARQLKKVLQTSRNRHLQAELQTFVGTTSAGEILHRLRPFLGSTNPKKQKKAGLPCVRQQDGSICTTPLEAQDRWIEFFSHMEGGDRVSAAQYRHRWLQNLRTFCQVDTCRVPITDLPSLADVEAAFRRVAVGKAVGEDGMPPELCRYKAVDLARLCYSMMLKTFLYGQEAAEHKGGRLAVAWKHRGDARDCSTYRSLLVSSHVGKTIHRALRQKHHGLYTSYMQSQQLGGRPKMPVGIPLHLSRAFLRWQQRLGQPTALIFLDLTEAFYRVVRPLALGGQLSDDQIAAMACKLGLGEDALHTFHAQLQCPSALAAAGASPVVQRFLQALHVDTWFRLGTQEDVVHTSIGSRPGDCYADVVFGFLWSQLLRAYEEELHHHGILETVPCQEFPHLYPTLLADQGSTQFLGPTWMDDLNVCLAATSNLGIERKAGVALSLLLDKCRALHMEPNLKKGKTEVMFTFRGPQSREYRRKYFSHACSLPVVGENGVSSVAVVSRYLHLGGQLHHRSVDGVEVTRRLAIAHQAFTLHRKTLFHNRCIEWNLRQDMFSTLVLSKLTYGLESWTLTSQRTKEQFYQGVMKLYRRLLKLPYDHHVTDLDLLTQSGMPKPDELLRCCRLRYFGTLHNCGSAAHWGLLQEDHAWITLLKDDLNWLWSQLEHTSHLGNPVDHYPAWKDLIIFHGGYWKKLIRRGLAHAIAQRANYGAALHMHHDVGCLLLKEGWVAEVPNCAIVVEPPEAYGCMLCQKRHLTHAGEQAHMFRCHGKITPARFLFDETHCPSCLREYHTRAKVLAHLRTAVHCRQVLLGRGTICQPMPGTGSTEDRHLDHSTDGAVPFLQAMGPVLPQGRLQDFEPHSIRLLEDLYLALLDLGSSAVLEATLRQVIRAQPYSWTTCRRTLQCFVETFTEQDAEVLPVSFAEVRDCILSLALPESWDFLQCPCDRVRASLSEDIVSWEQWCGDIACASEAPWLTLRPLPRALCREKVILHAYAGRRRRGDIQWYVETLMREHPSQMIFVASVDIVIDEIYGDISRVSTRDYWLGHILQGYVIGFLAGPPCNTWSRARHHVLASPQGPRVVRTPDAPWGLASLRLSELKQVYIGNLLLGFAIHCMAALALRSGTGFVEHPRDPGNPAMVSIWRLPLVRLVLSLPGMRLVHLCQGLFGAPSPKPTTLMVLGLPNLEKQLNACRIAKELPTSVSVGKDHNGQFRTAPLKEYPPSMCRAIAQALVFDFISMECDESALPVELTKRCTEMSAPLFGKHIGHDG